MNESSEQAIHPWLATDAEVVQVASRLGILLEPGSESEITENYSRIFLFTGDGGEQRVLKIRSRWMTERRLRFEHALARHLCDHGLPVVVPLSSTEISGLYCEVLPYIDGREASPSLADVGLMGELLSRFHRFGSDLHGGPYEPPHFENQVSPHGLAAEIAQLRDVEAICDLWSELDTCYGRQEISLPQVIRHGDFHPWNLLFSRGEPARITALFDFDMSARGPRVFDIGYALFFLRFLHPEQGGAEWETRYSRFTESYAETSGLSFTDNELAAIPLCMKCIALGFLVRKAVETGAGSTETAQEYENYVALDEWLKSAECPLDGIFTVRT